MSKVDETGILYRHTASKKYWRIPLNLEESIYILHSNISKLFWNGLHLQLQTLVGISFWDIKAACQPLACWAQQFEMPAMWNSCQFRISWWSDVYADAFFRLQEAESKITRSLGGQIASYNWIQMDGFAQRITGL